jgi:hypothetical protein
VRSVASAVLAACAALLPACHVPEAKVWNLEQLHDPTSSRHRYTAALEGDTGFFFRHKVLGMFSGAGVSLAGKDADTVEDPAGECLKNLVALEEEVRSSGRTDPTWVEWFARLAVEDAAQLTRERAVLALTLVGSKLPVGLPAKLGADQTAAGPAELGPAIEALVRSARLALERKKGAEEALAKACAGVRALEIDLAAGRRALRAAAELERPFAQTDARAEPLRGLIAHLEAVCVRRALGGAVEDPAPIVRAAALHAVAGCAGVRGMDTVLYDRLRKESATEPLLAILEELAARGVPAAGPDLAKPAHARDDWLTSVYTLAVQHPESEVRVRAMQTLQRISGAGIASLREEDWQAWWLARGTGGTPPGPKP